MDGVIAQVRYIALGILLALALMGAALIAASRDDTALIQWSAQQERIYQ